jgi:F0F1-type ATP synthase epsilon subunit
MSPSPMKLKVLLPFRVFTEKANVTRIVADTSAGLIGLLPNRLDCVAALSPGILVIETEDEDETYVAIDDPFSRKSTIDDDGIDTITFREARKDSMVYCLNDEVLMLNSSLKSA